MLKSLLQRVAVPDGGLLLYGRFGMTVKDLNGNVIRRIQKKNQVVNTGRLVLLDLLCQLDATLTAEKNQLWSLEVGTGTIPPLPTDLALETSVWKGALAVGECTISGAPSYEIRVYKTLTTSDANGYALSEAGLFTRGDDDDPTIAADRRLYARQTHPVVNKTSSMSIVYDWRLGVTAE